MNIIFPLGQGSWKIKKKDKCMIDRGLNTHKFSNAS